MSKEKEILKIYKQVLEDIRKILSDIYLKYEIDGKLTYDEMTKYERLSNLEEQIIDEMNYLYKNNYKIIKKNGEDIYKENFYKSAYKITKESGVMIRWGLINKEILNAVIEAPVGGLTLSDRLEKHRNEIIFKIKQELGIGLTKGESYKKMADRLKNVLDGDASKSLKIMRTEAHRIQNQAIYDTMKKASDYGITTIKIWDATLDDKTRDDHREMDGVEVEFDEYFVLPDGSKTLFPGQTGNPGQDINCRCSIRTKIKEIKTDKPRHDLSDLTYQEFKNKFFGK